MKPPFKIHASSARSWKHCVRRAWYDVNPPEELEPEEDRFYELIAEYGIAHEKSVLEAFPDAVEAASAEHTLELIEKKVPVIYQPVLVDSKNGVIGKPDFLILTDSGEYQVADAKLASSVDNRPEIRLQLGVYRMLLGTELPALVYLGNGEVAEVGDESLKPAEKYLSSMKEILSEDSPPAAYFGESKCKVCPYDDICRPEFIAAEDLSLVYGLDGRNVSGLKSQGINTVSELASAEAEEITDVPYLKGHEKKERAVLQAKSYLSGEVIEIKPIELPAGTWVHFDVEVNPLCDPAQVYLWGWLAPPYERDSFSYTWSDGTLTQDKSAWLEFLAAIEGLKKRYSDLVLVHFSHYEVTQIRSYAERYEMQEHTTVAWLLGDESPLFDLLPAIKNSLVLPLLGYGLKAICKDERLVNFQWEVEESGSQWSVVRYIDYLNAEDPEERERIKAEILSYNRDDVLATRAVEEWVRGLG